MNKTRRSAIVDALAEKIKEISVVNGYRTDLDSQVFTKMVFWDDLQEFPAVCLVSGTELLVHQGGGLKDRFLDVSVRAYVNSEEPLAQLEGLLEDIEQVIDNNGRLAYNDTPGNPSFTRDIIITVIDTDQGALAPLGVGELTLQVKY